MFARVLLFEIFCNRLDTQERGLIENGTKGINLSRLHGGIAEDMKHMSSSII